MSVKHFIKMMSLAVVLLLGSMQLAQAQNITLNFDRTPLKTVLNEIQKQVDYTFVYNDQQVGADKPVTIHVQNAGLTAVLDQMLKPLNINYKILDKQIALSPAATAAQQQGRAGQGGVVPADEVFVVTEVEITLPGGWKKEGPLYVPEASLLDASGTMVYRGAGEFRQTISGQGAGKATVTVTYQCCNNNTCLVPETRTFTVKL